MLLKLSAFPHGLLIGVAVLALTSMAEAQRRDDGRAREIQQHEQRIRQAQQRLEALQREESSLRKEVEHLDKHLPKVRDQVKTDREELHQTEAEHRKTKDAVQAAKDAVKSQAKQLDELEAKIEAAQPIGSTYAKAKVASEATKTAYQKAVDEAEESPEYKVAYQEAMASENKATLLPAVRKKWLDEKPAVVESRQKMLAAKEAYENLREPLLAKNPEWIKALRGVQEGQGRRTGGLPTRRPVGRQVCRGQKVVGPAGGRSQKDGGDLGASPQLRPTASRPHRDAAPPDRQPAPHDQPSAVTHVLIPQRRPVCLFGNMPTHGYAV